MSSGIPLSPGADVLDAHGIYANLEAWLAWRITVGFISQWFSHVKPRRFRLCAKRSRVEQRPDRYFGHSKNIQAVAVPGPMCNNLVHRKNIGHSWHEQSWRMQSGGACRRFPGPSAPPTFHQDKSARRLKGEQRCSTKTKESYGGAARHRARSGPARRVGDEKAKHMLYRDDMRICTFSHRDALPIPSGCPRAAWLA